MWTFFLFTVLVYGLEAGRYCEYQRSNIIDIDCDVSMLNSSSLEWRAFDSRTNMSLTIYRCSHGDDCGFVVQILNGTLAIDSVSRGRVISSSGLEVPEVAQYYNVYNQFQCWGGDSLSLACETPDIMAAVINPTCSSPVFKDNGNVTVQCRAATFFKPDNYSYNVVTNKRTRNITIVAIEYYQHYSPIDIQGVRYYDVNFTLITDLSRLKSGYHKISVTVSHETFSSSIASTALNVTSKADTPNCDIPQLSNDSTQLVLMCRTTLVFPQLHCDFIAWTNKTLRNVTGEVIYSGAVHLNSSSTSYKSECTLHVNVSHLGPGSHEFQVDMYTSSSSNNTVTGKVTPPFQMALPTVRLSDECVQKAKSLNGKIWSDFTCLCLLDTPGIPTGSIAWSVNNVIRPEPAVTAYFNDFAKKVKYMCIPETPLQANLSGVELNINVSTEQYCKYHRSNSIQIDCDVSNLKSGHLEWRAFDSHTNTSLTIYRCSNGFDCAPVVPILNGSVGFESESAGLMVSSSGMEVPEIAQYYNVYSQFQCWGGDSLSLVCDTPDMLAAVINPTCSSPMISGNANVTVVCRAATFFKPNVYSFALITNKRTRNISTIAIDYSQHYSPIEIQGVQYYDVNFTLVTDLSRLKSGYHKISVAVSHKTFSSSIASTVLNVTSKPNNPSCEPPQLSNDSSRLVVTCSTELVYPQLECDFNTWTNQTLRNVSRKISYSINLDLNSSPTGYLSECTLQVNVSQLGPGSHEFQVDMYTNSTSNSTVAGQVTAPFDLALPSVRLSDECVQKANSLYGKIWSNFTCLCLLDKPGIPKGSVAWSVNNVIISEPIVNAIFNDFVNRVKYECKAETPLQANLSGVELKVSVPRPPHITYFTVNSSSVDIMVNLSNTVTFRCGADGLPPPTMLFGKNTEQTAVTNNSVDLPFTFTDCLDMGLYCCSVENSTLYKVDSKCLTVFVRCPQVPLNQSHVNVTVEHGRHLNLTLAVYGYPAPRAYTLHMISQHLNNTISPTRYTVLYINESLPYGRIRLLMSNIQEEDFGDYTLYFSNGIGEAQKYQFSIIRDKTGDNDNGSTTRDIAIGVSVGITALIISIVLIIVLVKKGFCRRNATNTDSELTKLSKDK